MGHRPILQEPRLRRLPFVSCPVRAPFRAILIEMRAMNQQVNRWNRSWRNVDLAFGIAFGLTACLTPGKTVVDRVSGSANGSTSDLTATAGGTRASAGACDLTRPIITLTYDDSLPTQLSTVAPALRTHHLRATFFVVDVTSDEARWAALKADGHELGAHTFNHPCPKSNSWVQPGKASEDYSLDRMAKELDANIAELKALGQQAPFSFAYPCGVQWVGETHDSYVGLIKERFAGARGVVPGVVMTLVDAYNVAATFSTGSGSDLKRVVDLAKAQNGWIVFGFHGVGGDSNAIAVDAHEELLTYLQKQVDYVQVLPFGEALKCVSSK